MAGDVKGICIEFRGDTTKLDKALRTIQKETKSIDTELKNVNKALKFNPTSVELWRQKQDLLKRKIGETEDKLKALKAAQKDLDAKGVDKSSAEYQKLRRQIIETESQLKTFKGQLRSVGNVNLRATSEQFKNLGTSLTNAGQALKGFSMAGAAVVAMLGTLTYKSGAWADELNTLSKRYRIGTGDLQKYAASAALVDTDVETIAASHRKLTKAMSGAEDETGAQAKAFARLGVSVTNADGTLRDSDAVWQDTIKALGEVENETERDALAMTLMGKSAGDLNTLIEDGGETYKKTADLMAKYHLDFVDQETLDRANTFNDQLDTIRMLGTVAFQQLGTQLAAYLAPVLEKVVDLVGRFAEWLSNLDPRVVAIIGAIGGFVAVLSPLLIGLGKVAFAISSIMSLMATLGPAIGGIVTALGPVVLAIGAVIAVGVLLYKNWDTIKAKAIALWNNIKTTFNSIKTTIIGVWNNIKTSLSNAWNTIKNTASSKFNAVKEAILTPIQNLRDRIKGIIDKIKGFFSFHVSAPHIPLPHFSIRPSGWKLSDLLKGSIPSLGIDWYKTGGIFDSPSVIGVGEAGAEAVVPLDKLWDKLDAMQGGVVININGANASPYEIAQEVKRELIRETNRRRLAWQ